MSKSLGNVISPHDVVVKKAMGVDVLRWWVAKHASSSASVGVGDAILTACKQDMDRLRNCFRFLLGQISSLDQDYKPLPYKDLMLIDKLVLYSLHKHCSLLRQHYDNMEYAKVCLASLQWLSWFSASYLGLCKDRIYCDHRDSVSRHAGLSTMVHVTRGLASVLSPVLPHVCHELSMCARVLPCPFTSGWYTDDTWVEDTCLEQVMVSLEGIREELNRRSDIKMGESEVEVMVGDLVFRRLEDVDPSEVAEVLGVLKVNVSF